MFSRSRQIRTTAAWRVWGTTLALLAAVTLGLAGCDILPAANPSSLVGDLAGAVTLRIENLSNSTVDVEAVFLAGAQAVRTTQRRLAASGTEAYEEIIPTNADTVQVTAREPGDAKTSAMAATGRVLMERTYQRGVDYTGDEMIVFLIPAQADPVEPNPLPIIDCNENQIDDAEEIASNPCMDCNLDGILDVCQAFEDCNQNGTPDICEELEDCNADGIPDECQILPDQNENGIPDACEILGDFDGDGLITMSDVSLFTSILLAGGNPPWADLNDDNAVNGLDLQVLVQLILEQ